MSRPKQASYPMECLKGRRHLPHQALLQLGPAPPRLHTLLEEV